MSTSPTTTIPTATRALHLVDLENLAGDPRASAVTALATFGEYLKLAEWRPGDHVIVASNPHLVAKIAFDAPVPWSLHAAFGEDGADTMLLSHAPPEWVARRFGRLVVGSGDHIFAPRAAHARALGVEVLVVARADGCSHQLRAHDHRFLADDQLVLAA